MLGSKKFPKKINLRQYGNKPFIVAVIHGGPGAPGKCVHNPWLEREAKAQFYETLRKELKEVI